MIRIGRLIDAIQDTDIFERNIIIIGAGKDGKRACKTLLEEGKKVRCFIDANVEKWDREYFGVKVVGGINRKDALNNVFLLCIGVISFLDNAMIQNNSFIKSLNIPDSSLIVLDKSMGMQKILEQYLQVYHVNVKEEILNLPNMPIPNFLKINDEVRKSFLIECGDLILPRIFNEWSEIDEGPYEDETFEVSADGTDVVLDCGANLGLFSASVAKRVKKVYAFEPIPKTVVLLKRMQLLYPNIEICNIAVSDMNGIAKMTNSANIDENKIIENTCSDFISVQCQTLDDFVVVNKIEKVDFIKADIEGHERQMLNGAQNILREFAPKLSICTYHLEDDPIVLEKIINSNFAVVKRSINS